MKNPRVTIAILINCEAVSDRLLLSGIFNYIHSHGLNWATVLSFYDTDTHTPAGCIADDVHVEEAVHLMKRQVPLVALDIDRNLLPSCETPVSHVKLDNKDIAAKALAHFDGIRTYRGYVYVHDREQTEWSIQRECHFRRGILGRDAAYLETSNPANEDTSLFTRRLADMPKPIAIFCASDRCASNVLSACKSAGFRIPGDFAILGVDNDTFLCDYNDPSLSSIEPDFEREGFTAAKELHRLLCNPRSRLRRIPLVPSKGVITRSSTRAIYSVDTLVQTGVDYIRNNFQRQISVMSVANAMGVSRRLAELRFRQVKGVSIGTLIDEIRIKHVEHLLKTSKLPMSAIAKDSGFSYASSMTRAFKRIRGQTPLIWARTYKKATASNEIRPFGDSRSRT